MRRQCILAEDDGEVEEVQSVLVNPVDEAMDEQEKSELQQHLAGLHLKGVLSPEYLDKLWPEVQRLADYAIPHEGRVLITSRPKLAFGVRDEKGLLPLYIWKQAFEYYGCVDVMPEIFSPLLEQLKVMYPQTAFNHVMLLFMKDGEK
jgi:hypothetical protein